MRIIQTFLVQGLQPRVVRDLMDRDKDIRSLQDLRNRFEYILVHIGTAHVENTSPVSPINNNKVNTGDNNRNKGNYPPRTANVSTPNSSPASDVGFNPPRPGVAASNRPHPGYVPKSPEAGGVRVNALSSRSSFPPPDTIQYDSSEVC